MEDKLAVFGVCARNVGIESRKGVFLSDSKTNFRNWKSCSHNCFGLGGVSMNIRVSVLASMIFYDLSLHIFQFLKITSMHPFYPEFPLEFGELFIGYELFWCTFWGIAFCLSLSLIFFYTSSLDKRVLELEKKLRDL